MTTPTREQVADAIPAARTVLKKVSAIQPDYFKVTDALILAWAEQIAAFAAHVPTEDLLAGVTEWFGTNYDNARPTPAAIIQSARQLRHERFLAEPVEIQNAYAELRDAAREHLLYEQEPALAIEASPRTPESVVATPEYVDCPTCGSKAGLPCRNRDTGLVFTNGYHLARENAAAVKAAEKRKALAPPDPRTLFCGICEAHPGDPCTSGGMTMAGYHPERRAA